ncbi:MAG: NAD(P)H-dependent oxidoreductase subunit E [Leptospiraceae bacterium]|nr:NAD(P)H-dependent oxidoreductase subunit E [Leptospiraceae bacterium]MDW7975830.1 NAD(P)H-dependent oxidoreductase subunit E [Leptospiraceae bacterium]
MAVKFSEEALKEYEEITTHYPDRKATLLPALWIAQREFGYISKEVMEYVAELVGVPFVRVYEVVEFYTMYHKKKPGRYHLQLCQTLSCYLAGAEEIRKYIEEKLNLKPGETSEDGLFSFQLMECLGSCHTAPVVQINDDYYENLTVEKFDAIIQDLKKHN